jgi:hypothetical protein
MAELALMATAIGSSVGTAATTAAGAIGSSLGTLGTVATIGSAAVGAGAAYGQSKAQGKMAQQTAEFNAKQAEAAAAEERAQASRRAQEQRDKTERIISRQRAVGAASGAGTTEGEGYLDLVGDVAETGQYYSDLEIAGGASRAAGLKGKAAASRWEGAAKKSMYDSQATGALVKGAFDVATGIAKAPKGTFGSAPALGQWSTSVGYGDDPAEWFPVDTKKAKSDPWRLR